MCLIMRQEAQFIETHNILFTACLCLINTAQCTHFLPSLRDFASQTSYYTNKITGLSLFTLPLICNMLQDTISCWYLDSRCLHCAHNGRVIWVFFLCPKWRTNWEFILVRLTLSNSWFCVSVFFFFEHFLFSKCLNRRFISYNLSIQDNRIDFSLLEVHCVVDCFAGFLERAGIVNWKMGLRWKIVQKAAAPGSIEVLKLNTGITSASGPLPLSALDGWAALLTSTYKAALNTTCMSFSLFRHCLRGIIHYSKK